MEKDGQPRFRIGERIVIDQEGTLCKVLKHYYIDNQWYYLLEGKTELYLETNLSNPQQYKNQSEKRENLYIEYRYQFGDIVRVKGYGQDLFVVIGLRAEIWRYKDSAWEDVIYELSRITDGQWLEASEEELTYITNEKKAKKVLNAKKQSSGNNQLLISPQKTAKRKRNTANVDELLDMYNDYQYLYLNFGETAYKKKMREILRKLEALAKSPFKKDDY